MREDVSLGVSSHCHSSGHTRTTPDAGTKRFDELALLAQESRVYLRQGHLLDIEIMGCRITLGIELMEVGRMEDMVGERHLDEPRLARLPHETQNCSIAAELGTQ